MFSSKYLLCIHTSYKIPHFAGYFRSTLTVYIGWGGEVHINKENSLNRLGLREVNTQENTRHDEIQFFDSGEHIKYLAFHLYDNENLKKKINFAAR